MSDEVPEHWKAPEARDHCVMNNKGAEMALPV
jgi:hypothetical protein